MKGRRSSGGNGKKNVSAKPGKKNMGGRPDKKRVLAERSGKGRIPSESFGSKRVRQEMPAYDGSESDASLVALLGETLRRANRPLGMDELLRITKLPRRSKKHMEYVLFSMQEQGLALKGSTGWSSPTNLRHVEGTLSVQRGGMGFVSPAGKGGQDVFIHPAAMNGAWHGDRVRVLLLPGRRGPSPEGRIVEVLERADKEIAVNALKAQKDGSWTCAPVNPRIQALFVADVGGLEKEVRERDLLLIKPGEPLGPNLWGAVATVNLEREDSPIAQEKLVKSKYDIPGTFPAAALAAAAALPSEPTEKDMADRRDLRGNCFVTIDGRRARDFDDAIEALKEGQDYRLRVAIADVSHYVPAGGPLDAEARQRGNSYYFPFSVEPMLPEALSNGLCSLRPGEPRLVMVADMLFSGTGERLASDFYPATISSKARLTYGQIERGLLLHEDEALRELEPVLPMLAEAEALARLLMRKRKERGSLDFDIPEAEPLFDEEGNLKAMTPRKRHFGHRLIEECMIAANEAVAEFLQQRGEGTLYRVHQAPDPEKLAALMDFLNQTGLGSKAFSSLSPKRRKLRLPTPGELAALLDEVRETPQEYTVNRLLLRSMMQARYEVDNEGHFGLASTCYCHFTSPIRRYADLVVHRALKHTLGLPGPAARGSSQDGDGFGQNNGPGKGEGERKGEGRPAAPASFRPYTRSRLEAVAVHINETERTAAEAEREVDRRLAILLLADKVGETFEGLVSGLAEFGIFVELPSEMTEGMVPLATLTDDFYQYLPEKQTIRGTGTGNSFRLGQPVSVVLTNVNLGRLEVTLEVVKSRRKKSRPAV